MMRWKVLAAACAALTAAACAAPSPETRFVQAGVLTEYSPAADLGVVMNGWAACKPGSQSWTSAPQKDGTTLVTFSCKAQDQLELNETIAEKSRTIRRMRTLGADALRWEVTEAVQELPKKLLETISAFSNMQGGTIILGLSEKNGFRPAEGFDADRMYAQMQTIGDAFTPALFVRISFQEH